MSNEQSNSSEAGVDVLSLLGVGVLKETPKEEVIPPLDSNSKQLWLTQKERPQHRLVVELAASGLNNKEIAQKVGIHHVTVNNIMNQPRSRELVVKAIRSRAKEVDEKVSELVLEGCLAGAQLLVDTIKDQNVKRSDRITAAQECIHRRYGKPNQPVNSDRDVDLNTLSIKEIAAELPTTSTATAAGAEGPAFTKSNTDNTKI